MTHQFKFGDHVRYKDNENPVFGVVLEEANPGNRVSGNGARGNGAQARAVPVLRRKAGGLP